MFSTTESREYRKLFSCQWNFSDHKENNKFIELSFMLRFGIDYFQGSFYNWMIVCQVGSKFKNFCRMKSYCFH